MNKLTAKIIAFIGFLLSNPNFKTRTATGNFGNRFFEQLQPLPALVPRQGM
jgi:hypothetical protein